MLKYVTPTIVRSCILTGTAFLHHPTRCTSLLLIQKDKMFFIERNYFSSNKKTLTSPYGLKIAICRERRRSAEGTHPLFVYYFCMERTRKKNYIFTETLGIYPIFYAYEYHRPIDCQIGTKA